MASLTPASRSEETTSQAMTEGLTTGAMVFVPSLGGLYLAMRNPTFRKLTNWQSRTAMVIMPALFMFGFTAENKMIHRMAEIADETEHSIKSVEWAERRFQNQSDEESRQLHDYYRESIIKSGHLQLVGDELTWYHKTANYVQANPFKCIAAVGVPAVGAIYYGQNVKEHLNLQLKILHTRVFGQFAVICTLLGVMGLKEMMDRSGKFVTESEIESRIEEMQRTRAKMMARLEYQASKQNSMKEHYKKDFGIDLETKQAASKKRQQQDKEAKKRKAAATTKQVNNVETTAEAVVNGRIAHV